MFNVEEIRKQIPILNKEKKIIYFDNAATSQKPENVINSITNYYSQFNANVYRGMYELSQTATKLYIQAHEDVAKFLNASSEEIIFTQGTTSGINWIAYSLSNQVINKGDVIVTTKMEHHSNILPWKFISEKYGYILEEIPLKNNSELDLEYLKFLYRKYKERVKVLTVTHQSNVLSTINNINEIVKIAHQYNTIVVVDGAQGIVHNKVDVKEMDCDFYVFSGHKIYGPMGIGVVYGKKEILEKIYPIFGGGEMLEGYTNGNLTLKEIPYRFEAGTPNVEGAIGLSQAIRWLTAIPERIEYETELTSYMYSRMKSISGIEIISNPNGIGILSFASKKAHPHDIASDLAEVGICVRAGFHCAQPIHEFLSISGSVRVSLCMYNTKEEIDTFIESLNNILKKY